jgi:hypothetical protein
VRGGESSARGIEPSASGSEQSAFGSAPWAFGRGPSAFGSGSSEIRREGARLGSESTAIGREGAMRRVDDLSFASRRAAVRVKALESSHERARRPAKQHQRLEDRTASYRQRRWLAAAVRRFVEREAARARDRGPFVRPDEAGSAEGAAFAGEGPSRGGDRASLPADLAPYPGEPAHVAAGGREPIVTQGKVALEGGARLRPKNRHPLVDFRLRNGESEIGARLSI